MENTPTNRFRIALSFAGEKREFVEAVAGILSEYFGEQAILYDKYHKPEFSRADLPYYLPDIYKKNVDLLVVVLCSNYNEKKWCGLEWNAIFDMLNHGDAEKVMLTRFGSASGKGLPDLAGYTDLDNLTPAEAADMILRRLALNEGKAEEFYVKDSYSVKNFILIPGPVGEDSFNERLRKALLDKKNDLHIGVDYYLEKPISQEKWRSAYVDGLEAFRNDPQAKWLFTLLPEFQDSDNVLMEQYINRKLHELRQSGKEKRVLFFESGVDVVAEDSFYVYSVMTDYIDAVTNILSVTGKKLSEINVLSIFLLLGPNAKSANLRRDIYCRFVSYLLQGFNGDIDSVGAVSADKVLKSIASKIRPKSIQIISLPMQEWYRDNAKKILREHLKYMPLHIDKITNDFNLGVLLLCGNDDIALGAYDVISEHIRDHFEYQEQRSKIKIYCAGFDGSEEMSRLINEGSDNSVDIMWGVTAKVDLNCMVDRAVKLYNQGTSKNELNILPKPVLASILSSNNY